MVVSENGVNMQNVQLPVVKVSKIANVHATAHYLKMVEKTVPVRVQKPEVVS